MFANEFTADELDRDESTMPTWMLVFSLSIAIHLAGGALFLAFKPWLDEVRPESSPVSLSSVELEKAFAKPIPPPPPVQKAVKASGGSTAGHIRRAKAVVAKKAPSLQGMGLLAIQRFSASSASIEMSASRVNTYRPSRAPEAIQVHEVQVKTGPVAHAALASLDGVSGKGYEGGIGKGVGDSSGAGVRLLQKELEVRGGLEASVIRQIVQERLPSIRLCYQTALLSQPQLTGEMAAQWTIRADGSVSQIILSSDKSQEQSLNPCVRERMAQWKFPEPKGGGIVNVTYPFVFTRLGS